MKTVWILLREHTNLMSAMQSAFRYKPDHIVIVGEDIPPVRTMVPVTLLPGRMQPPKGAIVVRPRLGEDALCAGNGGSDNDTLVMNAFNIMRAAIEKARHT